MPICYEIDRERQLVVCTVTGFCTVDDVAVFHERLLSDKNFDPEFSQLVDATGVTGTDITPSQMKAEAERSPFSLASHRAVVADTSFGFALARVYEIVRGLRGDRQVHVFRDRAAALEWLFAKEEAA